MFHLCLAAGGEGTLVRSTAAAIPLERTTSCLTDRTQTAQINPEINRQRKKQTKKEERRRGEQASRLTQGKKKKGVLVVCDPHASDSSTYRRNTLFSSLFPRTGLGWWGANVFGLPPTAIVARFAGWSRPPRNSPRTFQPETSAKEKASTAN